MSSETSDVSSSWFEFLAWVETNKRSLIWAGVGLMAVVFAVVAYRWKVTESEKAASEALLRLRTVASPDTSSEPVATSEDYLRIVKEYPGTDAAERALLLAAGAFFADGKFAEAQAQFEKLLREHPESPLAPSAAYGVAASLEALSKKDEALAAFQSFQTRYPKSALIDEAKLAMARIYEAKGQPDLALKMYEEIARPGATTGAASSQAMQRKQQLLTAHPELAKTNAPAATATNVLVTPGNTNPMSIGPPTNSPAAKQ